MMEKFTVVRGAAAPLLIDNINTDQIAPVQFMRALEPDYQTALFARWRSDPGEPFVLDMPRFHRAPILVTGAISVAAVPARSRSGRWPPMACVASSPRASPR